ncbi:hypothetical protein M892_19355 [Vibrio campbellii ATCC BAA-1116]|uniref:Uncharacterized protein n=1 Tax=Vibrio campbellii (strain ATCC BAA-1116) TaxID=2902295 RepID=A7N2J4_VIBC1|nr:hypothetical protein VIBHAR_06607 [Vibrio campbellii ATCC BAA-1116]AGU98279.1 hypothetical protein M892_19355 [Vibrio campbellii ATCC BAA-1116]
MRCKNRSNDQVAVKEQKTAAIIDAFLKHGGQTEREAKDIQGIFVDTAAELNQ